MSLFLWRKATATVHAFELTLPLPRNDALKRYINHRQHRLLRLYLEISLSLYIDHTGALPLHSRGADTVWEEKLNIGRNSNQSSGLWSHVLRSHRQLCCHQRLVRCRQLTNIWFGEREVCVSTGCNREFLPCATSLKDISIVSIQKYCSSNF